MKKSKKHVILILSSILLLNGCAKVRDISANTYAESKVGEAMTALKGRIISVRTVKVASDQLNNRGAALGGATGAVIGAGTGSVVGNTEGAILGAGILGLMGMAIGSAIDSQPDSQDAFEYVVDLDNGKTRVVVQGTDVVLTVGQRVVLMLSTYEWYNEENKSVVMKERSRIIPCSV